MPTPPRRRPNPNNGSAPADCISGTEVLACGPVRSRVYVLGERPGKDECCKGCPFVGDAGQTLRKWFKDAELDFESCRRWNACNDYQQNNPKPKRCEIERDRPKVVADIERCKPDVIVAVGVFATEWCLGRKVKLRDEHGRKIDVQIGDHRAVCVPIYHPSKRNPLAKKGKDDVLIVARELRRLAGQ